VDAEGINNGKESEMPIGMCLTVVFLDLLVFVLVVPIFALGAGLFLSPFFVVIRESLAMPDDLKVTVGVMALLAGFVGTSLGASWFSSTIRARFPGKDEVARWPVHPMRAIVGPILWIGKAYAFVAVFAWLAFKIGDLTNVGAVWPCLWILIFSVCHLAIRGISRRWND
jgi:hypothetical protein